MDSDSSHQMRISLFDVCPHISVMTEPVALTGCIIAYSAAVIKVSLHSAFELIPRVNVRMRCIGLAHTDM